MADIQGGPQQIDGGTPHGDADAGNPVKIGGVATAAIPVAVDEGDVVQASFDQRGRQRVETFAENRQASATFNSVEDALTFGTLADNENVFSVASFRIPTGLTATVVVEVSYDLGVTYFAIPAVEEDGTFIPASGLVLGGVAATLICPLNGVTNVRCRISAFTSGAVTARGVVAPFGNDLTRIMPTGAKTIADSVAVTMASDQDLSVEGNIAHDIADAGNPVKMGGHATASLRPVVDEDDRADLSLDLSGQVRVTNEDSDPLAIDGNVAHDIADSGNPVKIGGFATAALLGPVSFGDRVDAAFSLQGQQKVITYRVEREFSATFNSNGDLVTVLDMHQIPVASVTFHITAGFTGTITFEGAVNANFVAIEGVQPDGTAVPTSGLVVSATAEDVHLNASGFKQVRARVTAFTSGSATAQIVGVSATGIARVQPTGAKTIVDSLAVNIASDQDVPIQGDVASDSPDSGNPIKVGYKAVEFNVDPPTVDTDDDRVDSIATPQGIQWVLEGHPNLIHREWAATGVQTDHPIVDTVAAGSQIIIVAIEALLDGDTTANTKVRIGFGAANVPTEPGDGAEVDGMVLSHPGIAPGSGVVKNRVFIGGDGEELRITNETPTPGRLTVNLSYFISTL